MAENIGTIDRIVRTLLGLALIIIPAPKLQARLWPSIFAALVERLTAVSE